MAMLCVRPAREDVAMARSSIYVIQVTSGKEESVRKLVLRLLAPAVEDCYTPAYESMRRVRGEWKLVRGMLFPGYIFVQTSRPAAVAQGLKTVPAFTRLLGASDTSILALTSDEVAWLNAFTNAETHVVEMSEGVIEGDRVLVTKGPLRGHEGEIVFIDRHKRIAQLEVHMFGRRKRIKLGLEIVSKRP